MKQMVRWHKILDLFGARLKLNGSNKFELDDKEINTVSASNVDSGEATDGQVLTADGNGGASWKDASGGGSTKYLHTIILNTTNNTDPSPELVGIYVVNENSTPFTLGAMTSSIKEKIMEGVIQFTNDHTGNQVGSIATFYDGTDLFVKYITAIDTSFNGIGVEIYLVSDTVTTL